MCTLKKRNGFDDGFEIKPEYYSLNRLLFLNQVLSLQDVFLCNVFFIITSKLNHF